MENIIPKKQIPGTVIRARIARPRGKEQARHFRRAPPDVSIQPTRPLLQLKDSLEEPVASRLVVPRSGSTDVNRTLDHNLTVAVGFRAGEHRIAFAIEGDGCDLGTGGGGTQVTSDPEGCYSVGGAYAWGKQSTYGSIGMKVNNSNCGRNEYGSLYQCYQCNSNGSLKKWKATADTDSDCPSGYHVLSSSQADCK